MNANEHHAFLQWLPDLSVGLEELDSHHKEMIRLINNLYEAVNDSVPNDDLNTILDELIAYADYHFGAEEALFQLKHYPDASAHIDKHLEYREGLAELRNLVLAGDDSARSRLMEFLYVWWTRHILECDKKYTPYLTS